VNALSSVLYFCFALYIRGLAKRFSISHFTCIVLLFLFLFSMSFNPHEII
jgi:hypothetical protein